jgi:hypothetical protein
MFVLYSPIPGEECAVKTEFNRFLTAMSVLGVSCTEIHLLATVGMRGNQSESHGSCLQLRCTGPPDINASGSDRRPDPFEKLTPMGRRATLDSECSGLCDGA